MKLLPGELTLAKVLVTLTFLLIAIMVFGTVLADLRCGCSMEA